MLVFKEEGIKQSFKIILNTRGIIVKTKGFFSTNYTEVYSKLYSEVGSTTVTDKFVYSEFIIDNIILNFDNNEDANIIKSLVLLGKLSTERLTSFIGTDARETDIDDIDLEDIENDISSNRFNRVHPQRSSEPAQTAEKTKADTSTAATLDYLIAMRLKAALDNSNATTQQAQEPTGPPPINVAEFSFYAYIEGKQQGPYNEKQFANLVQYGLVDAMTFVWTEGMPQWQRAGMVEGTRKFFPQTGNITPPPPPIDLD